MSPRKRKAGRPALPKSARKGVVFTCRFTTSERAEINAAAERAGVVTRVWARDALLAAARQSTTPVT